MANLERLKQAELLGQQKRAGLAAPDARIPEREQQTIQRIGATPEAASKLDPVTLFEATYTNAELKNIPAYQQALLNQSSSLTKKAYADKEQAQANLLATDKPTASKLRVLEDAIRMKAGIGQESIGTSETYDKLGISGYATLLQSLNQRGTEMNHRYNSFVDKFTSVSQGIKDQYSVVADKYKLLKDEYDQEVARFDKITYQISAQQHAMNMLERQDELNKEARQWKLDHPSVTDQLNAGASGSTVINGKVLPAIAGASMASLDDTSLQAVANAIMKVESANGTKGAAVKNNNPGNIKMPGAGIEEARRRYGDPGATIGTSATDGGKPFIKFSSMDAGRKAVPILLKESYYANKTVDAALKQWSSSGYGAEILGKAKASTEISYEKKKGETDPQWRGRLNNQVLAELKKNISSPTFIDINESLSKIASTTSTKMETLKDTIGPSMDVLFNQMADRLELEIANGKKEPIGLIYDMYKALGGYYTIEDLVDEVWDDIKDDMPGQGYTTNKKSGTIKQLKELYDIKDAPTEEE